MSHPGFYLTSLVSICRIIPSVPCQPIVEQLGSGIFLSGPGFTAVRRSVPHSLPHSRAAPTTPEFIGHGRTRIKFLKVKVDQEKASSHDEQTPKTSNQTKEYKDYDGQSFDHSKITPQYIYKHVYLIEFSSTVY